MAHASLPRVSMPGWHALRAAQGVSQGSFTLATRTTVVSHMPHCHWARSESHTPRCARAMSCHTLICALQKHLSAHLCAPRVGSDQNWHHSRTATHCVLHWARASGSLGLRDGLELHDSMPASLGGEPAYHDQARGESLLVPHCSVKPLQAECGHCCATRAGLVVSHLAHQKPFVMVRRHAHVPVKTR